MRSIHWIALILVIIGAVNWSLVGLFQFDLVAAVFGGQAAPLSRVVYAIVGVAGIIIAITSATLASGTIDTRRPSSIG
jgi:hypothetical protein